MCASLLTCLLRTSKKIAVSLSYAARETVSLIVFTRPRLIAQLIPHGNLPSFHHHAINSAIGMAEASHQGVRNREIADPGIGIHVGCCAAHDGLDDLEPGALADCD